MENRSKCFVDTNILVYAHDRSTGVSICAPGWYWNSSGIRAWAY